MKPDSKKIIILHTDTFIISLTRYYFGIKSEISWNRNTRLDTTLSQMRLFVRVLLLCHVITIYYCVKFSGTRQRLLFVS